MEHGTTDIQPSRLTPLELELAYTAQWTEARSIMAAPAVQALQAHLRAAWATIDALRREVDDLHRRPHGPPAKTITARAAFQAARDYREKAVPISWMARLLHFIQG